MLRRDLLKNQLQWDDALDVWGVHGVGGMVGVICLGLFAYKVVNPDGGADGLIHGNSGSSSRRSCAVVGAAVYAFVFTYVMLAVIDMVTPVKVTQRTRKSRTRRVPCTASRRTCSRRRRRRGARAGHEEG